MGELKTMKRNVSLIPHMCLYSQKRFLAGHWAFLGPGSETKWYSTYKERPGGEWDKVAELMLMKSILRFCVMSWKDEREPTIK